MKRKIFSVLGGLAVLAVVTGVALAYYGGSGTGSAQAAAGTSPLGVVVDVDITPQAGDPDPELYPGDMADVAVTIGGAPNWPANRRARIASVDAALDTGSLPAGCQAAWFDFTVTGGDPLPAFVIGPGTTTVDVTGTLEFTDEAVAQDACSEATLTLDVTASPTP